MVNFSTSQSKFLFLSASRLPNIENKGSVVNKNLGALAKESASLNSQLQQIKPPAPSTSQFLPPDVIDNFKSKNN